MTFKALVESTVTDLEVEGFAATLRARFGGGQGLKRLELYLDHRYKDVLVLDTIQINKEHQGQAIGSQIMEEICHFADMNRLTIALTLADRSSETGTTSSERLRRFYGRFGFTSNRGRNKDFAMSMYTNMYRRPR